MIGFIEGIILQKSERGLLIHAGSIGYEVEVATDVLLSIEVGDRLSLYTYLHVREDAMDLYGFLSPEEKKVFLRLISVSSIGPKSAMNLLSAAPASTLVQWISQGDTARLVKLPGIGAKTAARMVLELKDKLPLIEGSTETMSPKPLAANEDDSLLGALEALGYRMREIEGVQDILDETRHLPEEQRLKLVLKALAKEV